MARLSTVAMWSARMSTPLVGRTSSAVWPIWMPPVAAIFASSAIDLMASPAVNVIGLFGTTVLIFLKASTATFCDSFTTL